MTNIRRKYSSLLLAFASLFLLSINASNNSSPQVGSVLNNQLVLQSQLNRNSIASIKNKEDIRCFSAYSCFLLAVVMFISKGIFGSLGELCHGAASALWNIKRSIKNKDKKNEDSFSAENIGKLTVQLVRCLLKIATLITFGLGLKIIEYIAYGLRNFFEICRCGAHSYYKRYKNQKKLRSNSL